jgi:hypothetical protein
MRKKERPENLKLKMFQMIVTGAFLGLSVWASAGHEFVSSINDFDSQGNNVPGIKYPIMPEDEMTPGELCANADEYRYPEKIKYCNRGVSTDEKRQIIQVYDETFGFQISKMDRADFKIDHLIPLCAGGSNGRANLWPQHKTVYVKTDKIEEVTCRLMSTGKLQQAQAVKMILEVKHNLHTAEKVLADLERRAGDSNQGSQKKGKN